MFFRVNTKILLCGLFSLPLIILMAWLAGSQYLGESKDYGHYIVFFDMARGERAFSYIATRFEPAFILLAFVVSRFFESSAWVYGVIVFFALSVKVFALIDDRNKNIAVVFFLFFSLYFFKYFALYELTVLRGGIGMSLAFYVFMTRYEFEIRLRDIFILIVAFLFHYSSALFFLVYFVRPKAVWTPILVFIAALFMLLLIKYAVYDDFQGVLRVLQGYGGSVAVDGRAVYFPVTLVLDAILVVVGLMFWRVNDFRMKVSLVGLMIGFAIYWSFLDYNVVAHRFRELTSVFSLTYVLCGVQSRSQLVRLYLYGFTVVNILLYAYMFYFRSDFLSGTEWL